MNNKKPLWKKLLTRKTFTYFCLIEYGYGYDELIEIVNNDYYEFNKLFIGWIQCYWFNDLDREYLIKNLNFDYMEVCNV